MHARTNDAVGARPCARGATRAGISCDEFRTAADGTGSFGRCSAYGDRKGPDPRRAGPRRPARGPRRPRGPGSFPGRATGRSCSTTSRRCAPPGCSRRRSSPTRDAAAAIRRTRSATGASWAMHVRYAEWDRRRTRRRARRGRATSSADEPVLVQQGGALLRDRMHAHITAFAREQLDALALRLLSNDPRPARADTPGYCSARGRSRSSAPARSDAPTPWPACAAGGGRVRVQRVDGCLPCHGDHGPAAGEQPARAREARRLGRSRRRSSSQHPGRGAWCTRPRA